MAAMLLSRLPRPLFWCACALVAVCAGYLVATGAVEDIGRSVGQYVSDQMKESEARAHAARNPEKELGLFVIVIPIAAVLGALVLWHRLWERRAAFLLFIFAFNVLSVLILMSSLPEKVARFVFSDEVRKASSRSARNP
jgi:hypothetical protein